MNRLNPIQEKILKIFNSNGGSLPSFRTLAREIDVSSTNTVSYHINRLKSLGYLNAVHSDSAKVKLNLKNILNLSGKPGVYVLLSGKSPFYIGSAKDIKNHILENVLGAQSSVLPELEVNAEKIDVAYHIVEDETERNSLAKHLKSFYSQKGFNLKG